MVDDGYFLELRARFGTSVVAGPGRIAGMPVGVLANQPSQLAGALDIEGSQKGGRFVRFCDAFGLPIVTLVDTPGFRPGRDQEWRGMIRHGAKLAFAYAEATVPRVCVVLRKAYGGAYIVMDCKSMGNDCALAWPTAEVAVMGAKGAVEILHRRDLAVDRRRGATASARRQRARGRVRGRAPVAPRSPPSAASSTRSSTRPTPGGPWPGRWRRWPPSASALRRGATTTSPCTLRQRSTAPMLLDGKKLVVTGVLTKDSIAATVAAQAQEQGAELVLTSFGRGMRLTERVARSLPGTRRRGRARRHRPRPTTRRWPRSWAGAGARSTAPLHAVGFAPEACLGQADGLLAAEWDDVADALHVSAYSLKSLAADAGCRSCRRAASVVGLDFDARQAWPAYDWMGVAKAALEATARYLARDLGPRGVRVNLVAAGPLRTLAARSIPGFADMEDGLAAAGAAGLGRPRPRRRRPRPCVALLSDWFPATTGEILHVDGGAHAVALAVGPATVKPETAGDAGAAVDGRRHRRHDPGRRRPGDVERVGDGDPVALLPHRPPFRFVDAVDELVPGERVVARYRVTGDEAFLAGHFPGQPDLPRACIQLEALAQAGAIALLADERYAGTLPLFGGVEERAVPPPGRARRRADPRRRAGAALVAGAAGAAATATVGGKTSCPGRLFFVLAPRRVTYGRPGEGRRVPDAHLPADVPPVDPDLLDFAVELARDAGELTLQWFAGRRPRRRAARPTAPR